MKIILVELIQINKLTVLENKNFFIFNTYYIGHHRLHNRMISHRYNVLADVFERAFAAALVGWIALWSQDVILNERFRHDVIFFRKL